MMLGMSGLCYTHELDLPYVVLVLKAVHVVFIFLVSQRWGFNVHFNSSRLDQTAPLSATARAVSDGVTLWKAGTHATPTSSTRFSRGSTLPGWRATCGREQLSTTSP